jgi:excisionase family DNA binding protein
VLEERRAEERAHRDAGSDEEGPSEAQEPAVAPDSAPAAQEAPRPAFTGNRSYSVKEAADASGRHVETVRRHIEAGRLKAHKTGGVGPWRIWGSDLEEWL